MKNPAFSESTLIGSCLLLAHATFYDALPSNAEGKAPIAPVDLGPSKRAPARGFAQRLLTALDNAFYRQRLKQREAYLARSSDLCDLERRIRDLERSPAF